MKNSLIVPSVEFKRFSMRSLVEVLFFLLLITLTYNRVFQIGINIYFSDFMVTAILILTFTQMLAGFPEIEKNHLNKYQWFVVLFVLLFVYYLFLVFYAYALQGNSIHHVLGRFRHLFYYPLLFFTGLIFTRNKMHHERYMIMIKIYILISVFIGLLGIVYPSFALAKIYIRDESGSTQFEALYYMIVEHGTALLCGFIVIYELLGLITKKKKILKSVFWVTIGLIGIIGSQNRSIYIVFLFSIFLLSKYSLKGSSIIKSRMKKISVFLLFFIAVAIVILIYSPLREKFQSRVNETIHTFSGEREFFNTITGVRVGRTIATFKAWWKTPVLGCGWGNQIKEYHIYDLNGNYVRTNYGTPHNYYLTLLYQTGIIGFIIMGMIFWSLFRFLKPQQQLNQESMMGYSFYIFYMGFLVFNIANTHMYAHPVFIPVNFFLLGSALSLCQLKEKNQ